MKYYPYGYCRNSQGDLGTDMLFTGQRLDDTGLYYYNARYYDPQIGRFISPDPFVQWSSGFDVVSSPLTVNVIPQGLGTINAPQGNYPAFTLEAPMNPQSLNRYSYVLNSPLSFTDPYGWWTRGGGLNFTFAICGLYVSTNIMVVWDDNGGVALAITNGGGGGIATPVSVGIAGQYQYTTADTIDELEGVSMAAGGSGGAFGFGGGAEYIAGSDREWEGYNVFAGVQTPGAEVHGAIENTELYFKSDSEDDLEIISDKSSDKYYDYDYYWDDYYWDYYWY